MKFKNILILLLTLVPVTHLSCSVYSDKIFTRFANNTKNTFYVFKISEISPRVIFNGHSYDSEMQSLSGINEIYPREKFLINGKFGRTSISEFIVGYLIVNCNIGFVGANQAMGLFVSCSDDGKISARNNFVIFFECDTQSSKTFVNLLSQQEDIAGNYDLFNEDDPSFIFNNLTIAAVVDFLPQVVYIPNFGTQVVKNVGSAESYLKEVIDESPAVKAIAPCKRFSRFINKSDQYFLLFRILKLSKSMSLNGRSYDNQLQALMRMRWVTPGESRLISGQFGKVSESEYVEGYFITVFDSNFAMVRQANGIFIYCGSDGKIKAKSNFVLNFEQSETRGIFFADIPNLDDQVADNSDLFKQSEPGSVCDGLVFTVLNSDTGTIDSKYSFDSCKKK